MKKRFRHRTATCPVCGGRGQYRIQRARKWKALPIGRSCACPHCHSSYIRFAGRLVVVTERGFVPFCVPESHIDFSVYADQEGCLNRLRI